MSVNEILMDEQLPLMRRGSAIDTADTSVLAQARGAGHRIDGLIIVAAPPTFGKLRKHIQSEVERRVIGQISKDMARHPKGGILAAMTAASASARRNA